LTGDFFSPLFLSLLFFSPFFLSPEAADLPFFDESPDPESELFESEPFESFESDDDDDESPFDDDSSRALAAREPEPLSFL
jgi:hypothetical protein